MLPCAEANRCIDENIASRLLAGALSPEERSEVERHLDSCPSCSQVLAEVARVFHAGASAAPATAALLPAGALPTLQSQEPGLGVGAEVGRYRIERRLAAGGMGVVFVDSNCWPSAAESR